MKKFEYRKNRNLEEENLKFLGEQGWELVSVDGNVFYLKKELKDETNDFGNGTHMPEEIETFTGKLKEDKN